MSSVPKDFLIDEKIAEVDRAIVKERIAVEARQSSMTPAEWNKARPGATKRLYNLLEDRYVLKLMKTWKGRSFYAQAEITGVRDSQGTFHEASKTRILDWAQINENQVQGGDIKSSSAITGSVEGGLSDPDVAAVFRSSSTIEKQRKVEARLWRKAKRLNGRLVLRAKDVLTGSWVTFEVEWRDYFKARLTEYSGLPDQVLQPNQRGPVATRVLRKIPKVSRQTAEAPEAFSKVQAPVELDKPTIAAESSAPGKPRAVSTTGRRVPDIFSEPDRCTAVEMKSTAARLTGSRITGTVDRMRSRLYEITSSPKVFAASFALSFLAGFIEDAAATERFKERMQVDGYVPVGSEFEVSGEYSVVWRTARLLTDPTIPEKMRALPICLRFDVALWRDGIRRRAAPAKFWDKLKVRFPVALKGGERWAGGSAVFTRWPPGDTDPTEWMMESLHVPSGSLLSKDANLQLEMIMDPDKSDEWVLNYLRLTDAMRECEKSVQIAEFGAMA